jgi:hypothetical protein
MALYGENMQLFFVPNSWTGSFLAFILEFLFVLVIYHICYNLKSLVALFLSHR